MKNTVYLIMICAFIVGCDNHRINPSSPTNAKPINQWIGTWEEMKLDFSGELKMNDLQFVFKNDGTFIAQSLAHPDSIWRRNGGGKYCPQKGGVYLVFENTFVMKYEEGLLFNYSHEGQWQRNADTLVLFITSQVYDDPKVAHWNFSGNESESTIFKLVK